MKYATYRGLTISYAHFQCPYCGKIWTRGGKKEGFVKARASDHVFTCFEVQQFRLGFVVSHMAGPNRYLILPLADTHEFERKRLRRAERRRARA